MKVSSSILGLGISATKQSEVESYSNHAEVASPLGFAVALSVAVVAVIPLAAWEVAVGAAAWALGARKPVRITVGAVAAAQGLGIG